MIKHTKNPFLHLEIKDGNCEVTGTGNTWQYLLLFAYKDKNGNEEVTVRLYEGNQEMFIDVTGDSGMALIKDVINALEAM